MQSRNLINIILLAGIVVLVLVLTQVDEEQPAPEKSKLTALTADSLNHVLIKRSGLRDVELAKSNGSWRMLQPYNIAANKIRIEALIKLATADIEASHDIAGLNLADYSLDRPKAYINLNRETLLEFGATDPIRNLRYIKSGNKLNLVLDTHYYLARSLATAFIATNLLPGSVTISSLKLPDLKTSFNQGKWEATPQPQHFSADLVTELINEWQNANAMEVKEYKNKPDPANLIIIKTTDKTYEFEQQTTKDYFVLIRHDLGLQYLFPLEQKNAFLTLPKPLDADASDSANPTVAQ